METVTSSLIRSRFAASSRLQAVSRPSPKRSGSSAHLSLCARINSAEISANDPHQGHILKSKIWLAAALALAVFSCVGSLSASPHRAAAAAQGSQTTIEAVLGMMDKSASDFRSLTADLENTKYTDVVKDTSVEKGHIYVRKDSKMRIEITEPDPRTILRVGDSLFVYTPKIKRVEEFDLGKNRAMVDQYVLLGFGTRSEALQKSYDVKLSGEEQFDGKKTFLLELTPKSDDVKHQITKIQMWIDSASWLPVQQKFYETAPGDYIQFHYTNMMKNLKIPDSRFKQDWPKDVNRVKPNR
jgi:outer membrane lipoprotein-sorting protein